MLKEDGRLLSELGDKIKNIQSDPNYMVNDSKRREVISLEIAISNK